jgi:hypothetical protein
MLRRMTSSRSSRRRQWLPWILSAALLLYVFGWATDWSRLRAALAQADLVSFLVFASADRLAFFVIWTLLQAAALRRFVAQVSIGSVLAIRGGSELLRAVSNPLSDAAFFLGLVQLCGGRVEGVIAAALVPAVCHFIVMGAQMTFALLVLPGGLVANRDVAIGAAVMWAVLIAVAVAVRVSASRAVPLPGVQYVRDWLERFPLRELRPFFLGFVALAVFDVAIQWLASRAFGVPISWEALTGRIPLVYLSFLIPTLGNFGTRELAWAALFADFGARDALIAYAFAVNAVFLALNVVLGLIFLPRALSLLAAVRWVRRGGQPVREPPWRDPTEP